MTPLFKEYNYATTIFSPLAGGMLTGKYNNGIPEGSRNSSEFMRRFFYDPYMNEDVKEKTLKSLNGLKVIADELGGTQAALAIAWCLRFKPVTTVIIGASNLK